MKTRINIYIMPDTHDKLREIIRSEGISMGVAIDRLIREKFDKEKKQEVARNEQN